MRRARIDIHALRADELEAVCSHLPARSRTIHVARLEQQRRESFAYLVAWLEGVAVGHVGIGFPDGRRADELCERRGRALVIDLWVEQAIRRRGVGRALMMAVEVECRRERVRGIGLDSGLDEGYAAARELYRALGYSDGGGVFIESAAMPPDAAVPAYLGVCTIWTKDP